MKAYITAISYYLPDQIIDNAEINSLHPEWSIDKIAAKTGIYERRISAENEFSSDMAVKVAEILFTEYSIDKESIDFLLLCTQSPDYFLPTTACVLQDRLGLTKKIGALDFNLGCSGFVYGLGLAKGLIVSGQAKNVLLITSETYSKFIHPSDKSNKTLFGDAAAATIISSKPQNGNWSAEIGNFVYGTDGSGSEFLIVRNGGLKNRFGHGKDIMNEDGFERNDNFLYMDGKAIFNFSAFQIPEIIKQTLEKNELSVEKINRFVLHQANQFMLQTIRKRSNIPEDKFIIAMSNCGNTVSSTIPIALYNTIKIKKLLMEEKFLICGFGVGLSLGACVLNFKSENNN